MQKPKKLQGHTRYENIKLRKKQFPSPRVLRMAAYCSPRTCVTVGYNLFAKNLVFKLSKEHHKTHSIKITFIFSNKMALPDWYSAASDESGSCLFITTKDQNFIACYWPIVACKQVQETWNSHEGWSWVESCLVPQEGNFLGLLGSDFRLLLHDILVPKTCPLIKLRCCNRWGRSRLNFPIHLDLKPFLILHCLFNQTTTLQFKQRRALIPPSILFFSFISFAYNCI